MSDVLWHAIGKPEDTNKNDKADATNGGNEPGKQKSDATNAEKQKTKQKYGRIVGELNLPSFPRTDTRRGAEVM
jgi:hypothetical protein